MKLPELRIGQLLRVTDGTPEKLDAKWFETGDIVEVVGIYPHIIRCQKVKRGKDGWRMTQCYPRNSWHLNLEIYNGRTRQINRSI